jgi:hypothetical protein
MEEHMTKSWALVDSRFRTQRDLHFAEWTAQLVIGYRALRRLVEDAESGAARESISSGARMLRQAREAPALPRHQA